MATPAELSPVVSFGPALVLGPRRRNSRDVAIRGSTMSSGDLWGAHSEHVWGFDLARRVAAEAYELSGIGPGEIDLFELHDAFTIGEIVTTEAIGLANLGEGGRLIESGHTAFGGRQPVNPSGGLLPRGHPLGATGVAQVTEAAAARRCGWTTGRGRAGGYGRDPWRRRRRHRRQCLRRQHPDELMAANPALFHGLHGSMNAVLRQQRQSTPARSTYGMKE